MGDLRVNPSAAGQWVYCPGSVSMQAGYPDSGHAGDEGDASHWAGAEILEHLKAGSDVSLNHVLNLEGQKAPNGIILTDEHINNARKYVDDVVAIVLERGLSLSELHIEEKIRASTIHSESWGTVDCWIYDPVRREVIIWDYKYGYTLVEVFENWQAINYAIGVIDGLKIPDQGLSVIMRIAQPRPYHPDGSIREWRVPATDLRPYANRLHHAAALALSDSPTVTSGDHCKYCRARHGCGSAAKAALAAMDYTGEARITELPPEAMGLELVMLQRASKAIESRLSGLEAQAVSMLMSGKPIKGWGLESGKGYKTWNKPAGEIFALGELLQIELKRKPEPITPTQALKVGLSKELVATYSYIPTKGLKLVRDDGSKAREVFKK